MTPRPKISRRALIFSSLLGLVLLAALSPTRVTAQPADGVEISIQGLVGVTQVSRGDFTQIYTVELQDAHAANGVTSELGLAGTNLGIRITLSDLSTTTNILPSDIARLDLFASADAVIDAGDVLIDSQTPTIGSVIEFDATGAGANRLLPDNPATTYFLIIANISSTATLGTAFRLGATAGHIGIDETGIGGVDDVLGSQIVATDANNITIGDVATSGGVPVTIPFGGETAMLLLLVGSGLYVVRRTA